MEPHPSQVRRVLRGGRRPRCPCRPRREELHQPRASCRLEEVHQQPIRWCCQHSPRVRLLISNACLGSNEDSTKQEKHRAGTASSIYQQHHSLFIFGTICPKFVAAEATIRKNVLLPLLPFHLGSKHEVPYTTRTITNAGQIKNVHVLH